MTSSRLQFSSLPGDDASPTNGSNTDSGSTTTSPARGAEMRNFLQARLQKNRAPPLVHSWDFWHDRQSQQPWHDRQQAPQQPTEPSTNAYEDRLEILANVDDVRKFWNVFNNFDVALLQLRDSIHLFHKGIKPVWEDPRNTRGGSWTFRVAKAQASEFWKEVCMLAIGEKLQEAVESDRTTFRDDVCGISFGVRFNSMLIQIWNRDAEHQAGVDGILNTVLDSLSEELRPREGSYYYKKHSQHSGFSGSAQEPPAAAERSSTPDIVKNVQPIGAVREPEEMQSLDAIIDKGA